MEAKRISLIGMVLGAVIIIGYNTIYVIVSARIPTIDEQQSILLFGGSIMLIFSPVYLSIFLEKIIDMIKGRKE
jgi:hypothetical protein